MASFAWYLMVAARDSFSFFIYLSLSQQWKGINNIQPDMAMREIKFATTYAQHIHIHTHIVCKYSDVCYEGAPPLGARALPRDDSNDRRRVCESTRLQMQLSSPETFLVIGEWCDSGSHFSNKHCVQTKEKKYRQLTKPKVVCIIIIIIMYT